MAPIRRYLRITKYSVLEVRIYLHRPSDAVWLLSERDRVLPRIMDEVRPKVLPKLREENANAQRKSGGGKKKGKRVKDVASQEDFEVSIFLKETSTRHSLLTKHKEFSDKPKLRSTGNKLAGWLNNGENPIDVDDDDDDDDRMPAVLQENADDVVELYDIPEASTGRGKRKTMNNENGDVTRDGALEVSSEDEDSFQTQRPGGLAAKRRKRGVDSEESEEDDGKEMDDKKKLALDTSYDGFSIYGRILCLIVTRKSRKDASAVGTPVGGSQMMEQWVSTQAGQGNGVDEGDADAGG